jgi:hypothetical protein
VKRIFARKRVLMFEKNQLFSCWILNQGIQPPCQAGLEGIWKIISTKTLSTFFFGYFSILMECYMLLFVISTEHFNNIFIEIFFHTTLYTSNNTIELDF